MSDEIGILGTAVDGRGGGKALEELGIQDGTCRLEGKELSRSGFVLCVTLSTLRSVVKQKLSLL